MNEIEQLKKDILKLEFQHKKDIVESNKRREQDHKESQARINKIEEMQMETQAYLNQITKRFNHIAKLTGIAFENFEDIDTTFEKVSKATARKRKV